MMDGEALSLDWNDAGELRALAEQYGTPLMLYNGQVLSRRVALVREAFQWNPGHRAFFPVKEVCNPEPLRLFLEAGCGLLCSNANTLQAAKLAGAGPEQLLFTACFPSQEDWDAAVQSGAAVILDSPGQLAQVNPRQTRTLGLRVHPEGRLRLPGTMGGRRSSKFGMTRQEILRTAADAAKLGFSSLGLHLHAGSNLQLPGYYAAVAGFLRDLAEEVASILPVAWCDLGGGLAQSCDIIQEAALVQQAVPGGMGIYTELGRFVAEPVGMLLTRVRGIKRQGITTVGLDVSMAELPRICLPGVRYSVSKPGAEQESERFTYHLAGRAMDRMDYFGGRFVLPELQEGDLLAIHNVGINSCASASNFDGALRCAQVLLTEEGHRLIAPRQTQAQWLESCGFLTD